MKIVVLMYTFNGVDYLGEQLQSILSQEVKEDTEVKILVRDDGSTDLTLDLLDRYQREGKLEFVKGETIGKTKSFWELMKKADEADYYAFCEQDDVWFPEKLYRAVRYLQTRAILDGEDADISLSPSLGPLLYMSDFTVTNAKLRPVRFNRNLTLKYKDFEHSLLYSTMPGSTFVFNASARDLLLRYDVDTLYAAPYDDLVRNIVYLVGDVLKDHVPTIFLRKNKNDSLNDNYYGGFFGMIRQYLAAFRGKNNNVRSMLAKGLLKTYGEGIESLEMLESLKQVANYDEDPLAKERLLMNPKFLTGSFNDKLFKKAVATNKL